MLTEMNIEDIYPSYERGKIRNRRRAAQIRDFSGLRWENITPTDIDGLVEYHNVCYVFYETKLEDKEMDFGQKLALERLNDDLSKSKPCITIISTHNTPIEEDICVANTQVTEYRYKGKWIPIEFYTTTKELADRFINWVNADYLKNTHNEFVGEEDIPY